MKVILNGTNETIRELIRANTEAEEWALRRRVGMADIIAITQTKIKTLEVPPSTWKGLYPASKQLLKSKGINIKVMRAVPGRKKKV